MGEIMLITFLLMGLGTNTSADITTLEGAKKPVMWGMLQDASILGTCTIMGKGLAKALQKLKHYLAKPVMVRKL